MKTGGNGARHVAGREREPEGVAVAPAAQRDRLAVMTDGSRDAARPHCIGQAVADEMRAEIVSITFGILEG